MGFRQGTTSRCVSLGIFEATKDQYLEKGCSSWAHQCLLEAICNIDLTLEMGRQSNVILQFLASTDLMVECKIM